MQFTDNTATFSGGAVAADSGCLITAEHTIFENNFAGLSGGAAFFVNSMFYCDFCQFVNNSCTESAGAIGIMVRKVISER